MPPPDITALHLAGDDIFTEVAAGTSNTYSYVLPANHMGGTFWYHPHHHGSTAIHAGGGAAGMIIVEDAANALPVEVSSLDEMSFVLLHLNMPELTAVAQQYETNCVNAGGTAAQCDDPVWANGPASGTQVRASNGLGLPSVGDGAPLELPLALTACCCACRTRQQPCASRCFYPSSARAF